jgi:uncharacterized protein DUF7007
MQKPFQTPWGTADSVERGTHAPDDVLFVSTPGHGGILVGRESAQLLSPAARVLGTPFEDWLAFEEDGRWAVVVYEHPEWCEGIYDQGPDAIRASARWCLERWHAAYLAAHKRASRAEAHDEAEVERPGAPR